MRILRKVSVGINLFCPPHDFEIVGVEDKLVCLVHVAGREREEEGKDDAEPEVCRGPEEMVVSEHGGVDPSGGNAVVDSLEAGIRWGYCEISRVLLTVYNKMRTLPRATAKNTQPVQTLVSNPLKKLATKTAEMTMTVENSY